MLPHFKKHLFLQVIYFLSFLLFSKWRGGVVVMRSPHESRSRGPWFEPRQIEIHSVYQAVIGTGFTWQCGGMGQVVDLSV